MQYLCLTGNTPSAVHCGVLSLPIAFLYVLYSRCRGAMVGRGHRGEVVGWEGRGRGGAVLWQDSEVNISRPQQGI